MSLLLKILIAFKLCFLIIVSNISYASHSCQGQISDIHINRSGTIYLSTTGSQSIGSSNSICNLKSDFGSVTVEACKAIYSSLILAKANNYDIRLYFANDTNTNCNKGNWKNLTLPENGDFYHLVIY